MQKCEVCDFAGNPADAKFCIECASKLPIKIYDGATSRLSTSVPWNGGDFKFLMSGAYQDIDLEPKKYIVSTLSGQYNPPVGYIEGDSLYVNRNEYYELLKDVHTFQVLGERKRREYDTPVITTWMGFRVKVI